MDRRQLIRSLLSAAGLTALDGLSPGDVLGLGRAIRTRPVGTANVLDDRQRATLEVAAGRIIPADDLPGAMDADVATFIERIIADWYTPDERDRFLGGLAELDARAHTLHGRDFVACDEADQVAILTVLDGEVLALRRSNGAAANEHPFAMLKQMTVIGYRTSEVAMRAYGEFPLPMRYDGCAVVPDGGGVDPNRGALEV